MMFIIDDPETDEPLYLANVSLNITDQKKAKAALKEVNKKLNLLGSITRHDILNQITIAQGYLEILDMDGLIEKDSKLEEYCVKVTGAIETIKRQILFTKDYKDLGEQSPEWFNVGRIIDSNYKNEGFRSVKLVNETEDLDIFADPLFGKVIYNLFDNAVKHGEKITTIKFYYRKSGEDLNIICEDDGIGIPDEFKEKIFKREHYKNTGLGLFLSREILSITGMSIEENGVSGEGARFVIHIPKGMFRFYG
jgi:signal transduction histidine kinase